MKTLMLALLLLGCASVRAEPQPLVNGARFRDAVIQTSQMVHARLSGHARYPDHEWIWCLYGEVRNDTAYVEDMGVTKFVLRFGGLEYDSCEGDGYLGTLHNHSPAMAQIFYPPPDPRSDGCYFSDIDMASFAKDERAVITVVTCADGKIMARGKE